MGGRNSRGRSVSHSRSFNRRDGEVGRRALQRARRALEGRGSARCVQRCASSRELQHLVAPFPYFPASGLASSSMGTSCCLTRLLYPATSVATIVFHFANCSSTCLLSMSKTSKD